MVVNEHPESKWDLEDEEPDEAVFEFLGMKTDSPESDWIIEQGPIHDLPLDDLVKEIPNREDLSKTGIRFTPTGLKTAWRRLKQRNSRSQQTIQYHCSRHGCTIVLRDPRMKELTKTYDQKLHEAEENADVALLRRLEQRNEAVEYVHPVSFNTSVAMSKGMEGILSIMADAIGTSNIKLYCWLSIISILTLKKPLISVKVLEQEKDHFWEVVEERLATLEQKKHKTLERKTLERKTLKH